MTKHCMWRPSWVSGVEIQKNFKGAHAVCILQGKPCLAETKNDLVLLPSMSGGSSGCERCWPWDLYKDQPIDLRRSQAEDRRPGQLEWFEGFIIVGEGVLPAASSQRLSFSASLSSLCRGDPVGNQENLIGGYMQYRTCTALYLIIALHTCIYYHQSKSRSNNTCSH